MPQIICPNCGVSISLEARKEMDYNLVLKSLKNGPKTFTQLLRETHLPRKTLSLRLKELAKDGTIIKGDNYRLSGTKGESALKSFRQNLELKSRISRFIKENPNGNRDAFLLGAFLAFVILSPLMFYHPLIAYAHRNHNFVAVPSGGKEFNLKIIVQGADDLYAWQGKIKFNPDVYTLTGVMAGDFLSENTLIINSTEGYTMSEAKQPGAVLVFTYDVKAGSLLIGGSLLGDTEGRSGEGILTSITFSILQPTVGYINIDLAGEIVLLSSDMKDAKGTIYTQIEDNQ